ncbi:MAG: CRISPR-ssociated protein, Cas3 [Leptospirillum sp. Group II 'C75']|uniref:CRISPR-associated protein, Cas3 n=1 Tax=Leptospirillum sp. Group II '5-way CG' TaxID=419541 RepID=B6AMW0_9BACT|nr:type I-E CRISPR-associated protein Cas6/Cse3/CasE [Leptospirillum sp. Group II 'CF-1']AKS22507.1 hypothetical protein ABH19_00125 [Leptospirillum sp. Group II 'CF-1']EAY58007.1 MAG: CRISPR-ssociated protein, Cas3 [Leptospirillum rubarum]EDZ39842.1 MAG: CRISPR-associated protein, Cas3 [Leptospirillum sp. Group II '5-way CG']EIJ76629.1 MAG: CRISPR-ssociated protein, Cas3 [Leptospirillum sp. Group II 'C75']
MFLHRLHLDPRSREARRDLSDPYQLHSTLCRAFSPPSQKCSEGEFLWRLEPETDSLGFPLILVQSQTLPDWTRINLKGWLAKADPPIDLNERFAFVSFKSGQYFRFRLQANPCVTRNGKRFGLFNPEEQMRWISRKGEQHGFSFPPTSSEQIPVRISQEMMLQGRQHNGNGIRLYSVRYDGVLIVSDTDKFLMALRSGIGHGKAMGLGLLTVVPTGHD